MTCAMKREAWTWYLPSHLVPAKIFCSRCEPCTNKSRTLDQDFICIHDVSVQKDKTSYTLSLKCLKTDPFRQGVLIHVFNNDRTKPVDIMHDFRLLRISQGARPDSPLFVDTDGLPLTRNQFIIL